MSNESPLAQGQVDVLVGRLRAHAEAHEYIANADPEQKQWMNDLYDAADVIERALKEVEARAERYRRALLKLACLGNGDCYGNSHGNVIAQEALAEGEAGDL